MKEYVFAKIMDFKGVVTANSEEDAREDAGQAIPEVLKLVEVLDLDLLNQDLEPPVSISDFGLGMEGGVQLRPLEGGRFEVRASICLNGFVQANSQTPAAAAFKMLAKELELSSIDFASLMMGCGAEESFVEAELLASAEPGVCCDTIKFAA